MFKKNSNLWNIFHNERDFSYQGYDNQNEIIRDLENKKNYKIKILDLDCDRNKIIRDLENKKNYKIKILDLDCDRNKINEHFKNNWL
jgi:hypothetical protein